jgi:hypothetical protein
MKEAGIPASVVQDFIGHDDKTMSRRYTHTGTEQKRCPPGNDVSVLAYDGTAEPPIRI